MADQVLKARDSGVTFDIGVERPGGGYAVASLDEDVLTELQSILTELQSKLDAGGEVALDATTLAALENITVTVDNQLSDVATETTLSAVLQQLDDGTADTVLSELKNLSVSQQTDALTDAELRASPVGVTVANPTADPETGLAKETTLQSVLTELTAKLEQGQEVALNAATLAALETVNATITEPLEVDGTVDLGVTTLSALETINANVSGTVDVGNAVALDAATLAALESINATVSGTVSVDNLQTDALTDAELRAADVEVNDDAAQALLTSIVGALGDTITADTVRELLSRIHGAVDGLELSVDNIDVDMDDVESLLTTLNSTDFSTETTLEAARVLLNSIDTELATQQKDALTDTELRATPVSVTDTNPPQTDGLTNTELRAADVEVNDDAAQALLTDMVNALGDTITANTVRQLLSSIDTELGSQQTDALTDTELRASDVSVDDDAAQALLTNIVDALGDTITANTVRALLDSIDTELATQQKDALTDTELRATPVDVDVTNLQLEVQDDEVRSRLDTLNAKDFAEQTTLLEVVAQLSDGTADTVVDVLRQLITELEQKVEPSDLQTDALTDAELRASAVNVDIGGGTVEVSNLQQLAVEKPFDVSSLDLSSAGYNQSYNFANDSLLGVFAAVFSTNESRDITITIDGSTVWEDTGNTNSEIVIDFEDYEVNTGDSLNITISQTGSTCLVDFMLTAKIGTSALVGNPVLGEGSNYVGQFGLETHDSPAADAFGRLRVGQPSLLFDNTFQYDLQERFWDSTGTVQHQDSGSGLTESSALLSVAAGETARLGTRRYFKYEPGRSQLVIMTANFNDYEANVTKRIGYFDDNDGVFFENDGTDVAIVRRSSVRGIGTERVVQSNWNIDPMDGTGPSGVTLDWTKTHIFIIDFQWLGVGRVRYGIDVNGLVTYVHEMTHSNIKERPYMRSGTLPLRYEIVSTTGTGSMLAICSSVATEGGSNPLGTTGATGYSGEIAINVTPEAVLTIRPKLSYKGFQNRASVIPKGIVLVGDQDIYYEVIHRPASTTGTPSWVSAGSDSTIEYDVNGITSITGGYRVASGLIGSGLGSQSTSFTGVLDPKKLILSTSHDGSSSDLLVIVARTFTGTANISAVLQWEEIK